MSSKPPSTPHAPAPATAQEPELIVTGASSQAAGERESTRTSAQWEDRRGETPEQRADRNFNELLQEMRVLQAGVQILFAFLLMIPLQQRFTTFDDVERGLLLVALVMSALAVTCFIAPVAHHRVLFQLGVKPQIVRTSNRYARVGLAFLALAICSAILLALDLIVGRVPAILLACGLGVVLIVTWAVLPGLSRRRHRAAG